MAAHLLVQIYHAVLHRALSLLAWRLWRLVGPLLRGSGDSQPIGCMIGKRESMATGLVGPRTALEGV